MSEVTTHQQNNVAEQGRSSAPSFACPHCQSTEIQRFSVAYQSGISQINTKSAGIGMSLSGKVGIGGAKTKGQSQTELSRMTAPPKKRTYGIWIGCGFVLWFLLAGLVGSIIPNPGALDGTLVDSILKTLITIGAWTPALFLMYKTFLYNRDVHPKLMQQWNNSWVCFRCGHKFVM